MKKVLILGETSQLGKTLKKNRKVFKNTIFEYLNLRSFNFLSDNNLFDKLEKLNSDIILNFIAFTKVDEAEVNNDEAYKINELLIEKIIQYIRHSNKLFVHFSTDYVFDGQTNKPYSETDKKNPLNYYGLTKSNSENIILNSNTNSIIFRISGLYSEYGKNFIKTIISKIKNNNELNVVDDQISSPTNAEDVIMMLSYIINNNYITKIDKPELYHFTNEGLCSWFDIANVISKKMQTDLKINKVNTTSLNLPAKRPLFSKLNCQKIKKDFNLNILEWENSLNNFLNKIRID